jgi:hypothetical protein
MIAYIIVVYNFSKTTTNSTITYESNKIIVEISWPSLTKFYSPIYLNIESRKRILLSQDKNGFPTPEMSFYVSILIIVRKKKILSLILR